MIRRRNICGLVGVVGSISRREEDAFQLLLNLDTIRGPHSTGVAFIHFKDAPIIAKSEGTPWDLIGTDDYRKGMGRANAAIIGHNRFATKGAINAENAHPFQHDHIIGAHNGTLTRQSLLEDWHRFDVDSDNIYYDMSKRGYKSTIKRLDGAFALSWYDSFNETVNLCRNTQRPLSWCFSKDNKTVFWASEAWMLNVALGRTGIEHHEVKELGVAEHVWFDLPDTYPSQVKPFKEYHHEKVELIPEYEYHYSQRGHYSGGSSERKNEEKESETKGGITNNTNGVGKGGSAIILPDGYTFQDLLNFYRNQDFIEFEIEEEVRKPKSGSPHILCRTIDKYAVEVRIYQEPGSPIWSKLARSQEFFKGKVRTTNYTSPGKGYVSIDPRTLIEIDFHKLSKAARDYLDEIEEKIKTFVGFNKMELTPDEFVQLTNEGCMACNEIAGMSDHDKIQWVGPKNYLCKKCSHDPELVIMATEDAAKGTVIH